ncbi:nuclear transport factor 2 family protein [Promicromonospora sp. NPDC057488]|uniref:nuclear transport factor 2 family protein n=1 Tax=Promicromonospora sp. NPDC057488 TaxID=3346147 RepID=UPI00366CF614
MTHRTQVETWVRDYERLWRTAGTDDLAQIFTADATYKTSPWAPPVVGLAALAEFWDAERDGPDEEFTLTAQIIAVDGPTAVVRVNVEYLETGDRWRDLWILELDDHGLCSAFEEWPFAPGRHAQ